MILDFLLSPIADKNTFTGRILNDASQMKSDRDQGNRSLREREVAALETIAQNTLTTTKGKKDA